MKKLAAILLAFSVLLSLSACGQAGGQAAPTESPVLTTAEPTPSAVINGEMPDDEYDRAIWYGFIDPELASDGDRTVTWGEYCAMIGAMLYAVDEALGDECRSWPRWRLPRTRACCASRAALPCTARQT